MCLINGNLTFCAFYIPITYTPIFKPHEMTVEALPTTMTLMGTVFFCMICEDTAFYFIHRIMHHSSIYKYVHKMHHEYSTTTSIAAEYSHPLEYAFGVILPSAVGPAILGPQMHTFTVFAWVLLRTSEGLDGHCGYDFSWSPFRLLPFSGSSFYHDFHHTHNVGNYGSFFCLWDTVLGTNRDFQKYNEDRANYEKLKAA